MPRTHDMLTYRHPRTTAQAFRCDALQARASWRYTRPLREQIVRGVTMGLTLAMLLACMLDYFDCLVR